MRDVLHATRREYQKLGKTLTPVELGPFAELLDAAPAATAAVQSGE